MENTGKHHPELENATVDGHLGISTMMQRRFKQYDIGRRLYRSNSRTQALLTGSSETSAWW